MSALFPEPPGSATRVPKVADPMQSPSANYPVRPPGLAQKNGSLSATTTRIDQVDWPISGQQRPPSTQDGTQFAQLLPPSIFFARPPLVYPRSLTPLEELPPGSAGGPAAGRAFPRNLFKRQPENVPCTYCGRPTTGESGPDKFNGDHVIPKSRGGNSDPTNLTPACRTCNLKKGPRTPAEWYEQMRLQDLKS
jgi:5-methylcytosine-specific restriction endonuclease McrA